MIYFFNIFCFFVLVGLFDHGFYDVAGLVASGLFILNYSIKMVDEKVDEFGKNLKK